eukprot:TRINITY_DN47501_c0_g1_i1.p1 TRINITY_DN47501_c0_g1~~TRINITY_DN47501_c0_g1_i1.p1  ORF type:complete len:210 (-),score=41.77 TRINITY_DN47501_c0_g1_i1:52-681(-)
MFRYMPLHGAMLPWLLWAACLPSFVMADCGDACFATNPSQPCYMDDRCPGLGCNALGIANCRYCGFEPYAECPQGSRGVPNSTLPQREPGEAQPPEDSCSPVGRFECSKLCFRESGGAETDVISEEAPFFLVHSNGTDFEERLQCARLRGSPRSFSCASTSSGAQEGRAAKFLQQLTFDNLCSGFEKKVWRMDPLPVETCMTSCHRLGR